MKHTTRLTKRARKALKNVGAIIALIGIAFYAVPMLSIVTVYAGNLTLPRDYLNKQTYNTATGIQHEVFFKTDSAVTGGSGVNKIIITFPNNANNNTKWCRTAGSLTVTGIANPTGGTETATVLPGTLAGTCAQSSPDTFTITGVDDLTATTKYGVRFVGLVGVLGTGTGTPPINDIQVTVATNNGSTNIDSAVFALSLITSDQVGVSATVNPTLTVGLDTNTAALGVLSASNVNQAGIVSTVTTNAGNGYISMVKYNNTLTEPGTATIPDTAGGTIVAGTSEYGASTSQTGRAISTWSPAACSTTGTTSNATALSTTYKDFAVKASPASSEATTLCLLASIVGTETAGVYSSTLTVVTTARF